MKVEKSHWVSLSEAAETLGTTPLNVLMHIKRGLLSGSEDENGWLVTPDSLALLLARRRTGAAPAVCASHCSKKSGGCGSCS